MLEKTPDADESANAEEVRFNNTKIKKLQMLTNTCIFDWLPNNNPFLANLGTECKQYCRC